MAKKTIHLTYDRIAKRLLLNKKLCSNCLWNYVLEWSAGRYELICGITGRKRPWPRTCDRWERKPGVRELRAKAAKV
jgi:hypothetical protein